MELKITQISSKCICYMDDEDFYPLNSTVEYSGIEIALQHKGMLRARHFNNEGFMTTQDIIHINFCPLCGRKL